MVPDKLVVGLTGGIAAGKSFVADIFARLGATVISTDALAHQLYDPTNHSLVSGRACYDKLVAHFGSQIIDVAGGGRIDRAALATIILPNEDERQILNTTVWPYVFEELQAALGQARGVVIVESALLFESELYHWCDATIEVVADEDIRVQRLLDRNHITEAEARQRLRVQRDHRPDVAATFQIENNQPRGADLDTSPVSHQVSELYQRLLARLTAPRT